MNKLCKYTICLILILILLVVFFYNLIYNLQSKLEPQRKIQKSEYSLWYIKESLDSYKRSYGTFPPSYTTNADGSYDINWKVLTFPFTDYNDWFLKIVNYKISKKTINEIYGNIPERYFNFHNVFKKNRGNLISTNDFACFGIELEDKLFLHNSQTINFILFSENECVDFLDNGIKMVNYDEYIKTHINSKIIMCDFQKKGIKKKGEFVQEQINDIENKILKILSDKKDEELVIGAFLLAGELRFVKKGTNIHKAIEMFDDDYSELSKKIKKLVLKKIE